MKNIIAALFVLFSAGAEAQITAYFSHCAFNDPANKPFMETYLSVFGNTVSFKKNANGKYQGMVEVGILFTQDGTIKASRKYNVLSPEIMDTLLRPNFIDQQRFSLDTGKYDIELSIMDKNISGKKFSLKESTHISFPAAAVSISDVQFLTSFAKAEKPGVLTKNGFDLVPFVSDFFSEKINELSFYAEVYNTKAVLGENERFLVNYQIQSHENGKALPKYIIVKRETTSVATVILSKFNITDLPSGNYDLGIQIVSKENKIVAQKKIFFQRRNPEAKVDVADLANIVVENTFAAKIHSKDSLKDHIRSLRPVSVQSEKAFADNQLKLADEKLMQQFLYNFWAARNPIVPEDAWKEYLENVKVVNKKYGTQIRRGYETDRGRVYLQYGTPDKMEAVPSEPNAYPYEIWTYYKLGDKSKLNPPQTNKQFIFYDMSLVTNDYQLLHSNAVSETYDPTWQMKLHKRITQSSDFENTTAPEHFGGNAGEDFTHPK